MIDLMLVAIKLLEFRNKQYVLPYPSNGLYEYVIGTVAINVS